MSYAIASGKGGTGKASITAAFTHLASLQGGAMLCDLERVADLCRHFRIPVAVIINKFDLNLRNTVGIESYCLDQGHTLLGRLPHDKVVMRAMVQAKYVNELPATPFAEALRSIWEQIVTLKPRAAARSALFNPTPNA